MAQTETMAFYACTYGRCPVKWWPVEAGQTCPHCQRPGVYAGIAAKAAPEPPPEEDDQ